MTTLLNVFILYLQKVMENGQLMKIRLIYLNKMKILKKLMFSTQIIKVGNTMRIIKFAFMSIVSHECRSSITKEILAPFSRYTDRKMAITAMARTSKLGLISFLTKVANGNHINMEKFDAKHAKEAIICPSTDSHYNIDGEIYDNDEAYVKSLPGFLNMMGKVHDLSKQEKKYFDNMVKNA